MNLCPCNVAADSRRLAFALLNPFGEPRRGTTRTRWAKQALQIRATRPSFLQRALEAT